MDNTLIIWRRFGKEHGENSGFRANPPEVVWQHLQQKVETFRQTPEAEWHWRQVNDDLLIENEANNAQTIYYLPKRHWVLMHRLRGFSIGDEWEWYVHIGDISYEVQHGCWVFTDLFCDVIVQQDCRTHSVLDLDDLGQAYTLGLITADKMVQILTDTQRMIDEIRSGAFPPCEVRAYLEAMCTSV